MVAVTAAAAVFTACNADMEFVEPADSTNPETRAVDNPDGTITITFDDFDAAMMAGPTAKAENYYSYLGQTQVKVIADPDGEFTARPNKITSSWGTTEDFSSGCIALSKYNYLSNPSEYPQDPTKPVPADWWYSWENQCSVYNTDSVDGTNANAGHSGSNFGVVYGYSDASNQDWMAKPSFDFGMSSTLKGLWYCNSTYTYGVIMGGNQFGGSGSATALKDQVDSNGKHIGYFQAVLECYDISGKLIATKTRLLADYRDGNTRVDPVTTWTYWEIEVPRVKTVKFNFVGSDTGSYGLNTPAYICIDDITIE